MSRGLWSGAISFGLLNIPISVMSAKEEDRPSFHMLDKRDNSPIGYKQINKKTGREIDRKNIVKGYEYEKNKFVIMEEKDFVAANPRATQTIDIEDFVSLEDLDVMLFEKPYYLVPGKNGEKGYVLLRKTLEETSKVAIARFVLRNRQHLVGLMAKGDYIVLEMLRFSHEIQEVHEADFLDTAQLKKVKITPREIKMAKDLVEGMTAKWKPDQYKDTYTDDLMKLIKRKVKTGKVEVAADVESLEPANTNVIDLMPLLEKSLKRRAGNKPEAKARAKPKTKPKPRSRAHA